MSIPNTKHHTKRNLALLALAAALFLATAVAWQVASARPAARPASQPSPIHPTFALLDDDGNNVLDSGKPVSTMKTCGSCHNTDFIAEHSYHATAGLESSGAPGSVEGGQAWDTSRGLFGKWDPLTYRYLTPAGDQRLDLGTPEWIQTLGALHPGGGPATTSRDGQPLTALQPAAGDPQTQVLDPQTGQPVAWNWQESGVEEMNCFLCHTPDPDNASRIQALQDGRFGWANTATLLGSGIVEESQGAFQWNPAAFDDQGNLKAELINIQDPTNDNCGQCHGLVHSDPQEPLVLSGCSPVDESQNARRTLLTGQVISPQRISESGMNLQGKEDLTHSWDIHAERAVKCTDCHFALNNPVYYMENDATRPDHLTFDPRRLDFGEYLLQPLHQFARGESAQSSIAPELKGSMRRCESCHTIETTHDWLPYKDRHVQALSCETCHTPEIHAPALQQIDWTVIQPDGQPVTACRGVEGDSTDGLKALVTGYQPVLLPRQDADGSTKLAPYNLITSYYWVYGDPPRPVRLYDLQAAYLDGDQYQPAILAAFDRDGDGSLSQAELVIDTPEKESVVATALRSLGLENPRIEGEVRPYSINHNVVAGEWATRDCQTCHNENSRITAPIQLTTYQPGGTALSFETGANTLPAGDLHEAATGELFYKVDPAAGGLYLLGHDNVAWVDFLGSLMFVGVLLAITLHGGLRFYTTLRRPRQHAEVERVYMYHVYERLWHWLQTLTILLLIFTGLVIHKPETFGLFSFRGVVLVHNALALVLVINAGLSLFYHLASGEIRQFIPRPRGFFDQAIVQGLYYLRGIFKGGPHPFEKTLDKKLNPLQQATYFALLNVLLPLQIITGALMWGVQRWPHLAASLGGLPFLAPFHTLVAWSLAAFVVAHVYLTTTGHTPVSSIEAMINGWDELEVAAPNQEVSNA